MKSRNLRLVIREIILHEMYRISAKQPEPVAKKYDWDFFIEWLEDSLLSLGGTERIILLKALRGSGVITPENINNSINRLKSALKSREMPKSYRAEKLYRIKQTEDFINEYEKRLIEIREKWSKLESQSKAILGKMFSKLSIDKNQQVELEKLRAGFNLSNILSDIDKHGQISQRGDRSSKESAVKQFFNSERGRLFISAVGKTFNKKNDPTKKISVIKIIEENDKDKFPVLLVQNINEKGEKIGSEETVTFSDFIYKYDIESISRNLDS